MCKQKKYTDVQTKKLYHFYPRETVDPNKHLNESNLHFNSHGIRAIAENVSICFLNPYWDQYKVNSENRVSNTKKAALNI